MSRSESPDIKDLAAVLQKHAKHGPPDGDFVRVARGMLRAAKRLHRLAERDCNGEMTDTDRAEEVRETSTFNALCASIGCGSKITGDPRGFVARVIFPKNAEGRRPYNTWGGEDDGWGVA